MRELKFRAWYKIKKSMINDPVLLYDRSGISYSMSQESEYLWETDKYASAFEWMQYIGLKDKNGIEIFEGDIVKWGHIDHREERWHRVAEVKLFPSLHFKILFYIDSKTLEKQEGDGHEFHYGNFIYQDTHESLEVIGNIYENIELLEI